MNCTTSQELWVAARDVVSSELDGGAALLDLKTSTYYSLNPVGAFVWSLLAQPRRAEELQAAVAERYAVDRARGDADVAALIAQLSGAKLIEPAQSSVDVAA